MVSYFVQLYFPDISRFKDPDASQPEIMLYVAGKFFQSVILVFSCVTVLASGMAAHAGVSRLMYVMGRDGVFPTRFFGYVHPKWRTPALNVLLVGAIALSAVSFDLVTATALINFGALVAFTFVNLSVISQFYIRDKMNRTVKDTFNYLILPVMGALTVGALWVNLEASSMTLGLVWAAIGLICGLRHPQLPFAGAASERRRRLSASRLLCHQKAAFAAFLLLTREENGFPLLWLSAENQ